MLLSVDLSVKTWCVQIISDEWTVCLQKQTVGGVCVGSAQTEEY